MALCVPLDGGVLEGGGPGAALWGPTKVQGGRGGRVGVCGGATAGRGWGLSLGWGTTASRLGGLKPMSYAAQGSGVDLPEPLERGRGKPQKGSVCCGAVWEVASGVTMLALQEAALDAPAACTSTGVGLHLVSWCVPEQERRGNTSSSEPGQDPGAPEIRVPIPESLRKNHLGLVRPGPPSFVDAHGLLFMAAESKISELVEGHLGRASDQRPGRSAFSPSGSFPGIVQCCGSIAIYAYFLCSRKETNLSFNSQPSF